MEETPTLKEIYQTAKQAARKSVSNTAGRQSVLKKPFVYMSSADLQGTGPNATQSYLDAMKNEVVSWRKFKNKVYVCSCSLFGLFLGFGILSRWAPRWRNGLRVFSGAGILLTFGIGYKTLQTCNKKVKDSEDKAGVQLLDIDDVKRRDWLKQIVTTAGLTHAIDQFAGWSCVLPRRNPRVAWTTRTLLAEDLLNLNYNLFGIKEDNMFSKVGNLWRLRAIAIGYAAAKEAYDSNPTNRKKEFNDLCNHINLRAKIYLAILDS
jgi:hypothetical protein